jgi:hypothetical protein
MTTLRDRRVIENLRALGVPDPERLPRIPEELLDYIARLTPEQLDRIRGDVRELERIGLLPLPEN